MRPICFSVILVLGGCFALQAQPGKTADNPQPASIRGGKISAEWADRAVITGGGQRPEGNDLLWYVKPAAVWEEALPLGNGKLGAMVFGGVADERIQLNESTLWDGYSLDPNDSGSLKYLPEVQRLLFEGKNNEAVALAEKHMMGHPKGVRPYQSLGEIWFDTPDTEASHYIRSLDLSTAIARISYTSGGGRLSARSFCFPVRQGAGDPFFSRRKRNRELFPDTETSAGCNLRGRPG